MEWPDVRSTYLVKYESQHIDSYYFRNELQLAVYLCKNGNKTACEHMANMCTLTLFTSLIPCKLFWDKHNSPLWLYYGEGEAPTVLNRKKISQQYSLDVESNSSRLNITFATFSMNGQYQSISAPTLICDLFKNIRFGINIEKSCATTAKILNDIRMEFFEPYLGYREGDKMILYALPVLIRNTNKDEIDASRWQLVRRFFFTDTIAGIKALPTSLGTAFKREEYPTVVRYAKSINILIKVQNKEEKGKIFPPLLMIEYGELLNEHVRQNVEVQISYKITYILADNDMYNAIEVSTGVLSSLAVAFAAIKAWSHCKRNGSEVPNTSTFFWFFIFCCGLLGNVFIFVVFCASAYMFIFFKGQTVMHVLLPSEANEETVRIFVIVAFSLKVNNDIFSFFTNLSDNFEKLLHQLCLQLVEIMGLVYQIRNIDMFFIDWEQPRSVQSQPKYDSPRTSLKKLYANRFSGEKRSSPKTPSEIISASRNKTPHKLSSINTPSRRSRLSIQSDLNDSNLPNQSGGDIFSMGDTADRTDQKKLPVSIWRTYFIANEWYKIQTIRKVNMLVQGIATLFILEVVNVKFWARSDPELSIRAVESTLQERESFTLKFAVGTLVYMFVYLVQWLTMVIFYNRYVKNHIKEFIDLCSMANVSIFILSQNHYGYYIHGRSVHGFADTDLATLISDLKQEEENLCAHRGLLPGTTEQSFVISVSATFRNFYDKIMNPIKLEESRFLRSDIISTSNLERNIQTYQKMKQFLTQFIDHCFKDLEYTVRDKQFLEKLLDIEFREGVEKSIFYVDNNHSFDRAMFYGNEWMLVTFEITLFNFMEALFEDYTLAIIVTVFASQLLIICCKFNGKKNLAQKTLIDERFLL
ncbi:meckelin [Neodiprion pinetum]|uniref:meckelin n=1 Tax=Neodiprion pinetum TaxID=441929 RepID=UPI003718C2D4